MIYIPKNVKIEAFKWTGGPDQTEDPEWAVKAITDKRLILGRSSNKIFLEIYNQGEDIIQVNVGEYLVLYNSGRLDKLTEKEINLRFDLCL